MKFYEYEITDPVEFKKFGGTGYFYKIGRGSNKCFHYLVVISDTVHQNKAYLTSDIKTAIRTKGSSIVKSNLLRKLERETMFKVSSAGIAKFLKP